MGFLDVSFSSIAQCYVQHNDVSGYRNPARFHRRRRLLYWTRFFRSPPLYGIPPPWVRALLCSGRVCRGHTGLLLRLPRNQTPGVVVVNVRLYEYYDGVRRYTAGRLSFFARATPRVVCCSTAV